LRRTTPNNVKVFTDQWADQQRFPAGVDHVAALVVDCIQPVPVFNWLLRRCL
jgi:hypothetical protein